MASKFTKNKSSASKGHKKSADVLTLRQQGQTDAVANRNYQVALKEFWEGRPRTAGERIVGLLSDEAATFDTSFPLYRLWIEISASQDDESTLSHIIDHLSNLAAHDDISHISLLALQGIGHFKKDEIEAARMTLKNINTAGKNDPYVAELGFLLDQRTNLSPGKNPLHSLREHVSDYYHFDALSQTYADTDDKQNLKWLVQRVNKVLPGSPLPATLRIKELVAAKKYAEATPIAEALLRQFSGNSELSLTLGYIALKAKKYDQAIVELSRLSSQGADGDPEVMSLLGQALAEKVMITHDRSTLPRVFDILQRAARLAKDQGMTTTAPLSQINRLKEHFNMVDETTNEQPRYWLVKLSARHFNDMKTAPLTDVKNVRRQMGKVPRPGDLCFFLGDDYASRDQEAKSWRLGAVYVVNSEPMWYPFENFVTELKLVARPSLSIPIDVHEMDRAGARGEGPRDQNDPRAFGLMEIDDAGLQTIESCIMEFADEASGWGEALEQYRRLA